MRKMTTSEVAAKLGKSPDTVLRYARRGWLTVETISGETGQGVKRFFDARQVSQLAKKLARYASASK